MERVSERDILHGEVDGNERRLKKTKTGLYDCREQDRMSRLYVIDSVTKLNVRTD